MYSANASPMPLYMYTYIYLLTRLIAPTFAICI